MHWNWLGLYPTEMDSAGAGTQIREINVSDCEMQGVAWEEYSCMLRNGSEDVAMEVREI